MDWAAIFLTLVGAVIGTALSFYAPALLERRQYKRRKEFFGTWFSAYQSLDYQAEWVDEKVIIDLDMNQFRIRNTSNEADYDYIAHGELVEGTYLHGRYVSNRPGSNAFGAFVLCIAPLGKTLYGYWIGPNDKGERRYAGWVMARTEDDIQTAKKLLAETTHLNTREYTPTPILPNVPANPAVERDCAKARSPSLLR